MSEYDSNVVAIKLVIDGDKAHYQTDPYFDPKTNKIIIKRLATLDVEVIEVGIAIDMAKQIKEWEKVNER